MDQEETALFRCKFCERDFRRESTLASHLCEKKRRWQQENEVGVRFGFQAYLRFYESTQGSAKFKTYAEFVESPFYSAFVKFGQYIVQVRAINPKLFIEWIIKKNARLDVWTKDKYYDEYVIEYVRKENPMDALERSFEEMQRWADDTGNYFGDIFRKGSSARICTMITDGRISPWVIYNCKSGIEFLESLHDSVMDNIGKHIDPYVWQKKLRDYVSDVEYIKLVLKEANV